MILKPGDVVLKVGHRINIEFIVLNSNSGIVEVTRLGGLAKPHKILENNLKIVRKIL